MQALNLFRSALLVLTSISLTTCQNMPATVGPSSRLISVLETADIDQDIILPPSNYFAHTKTSGPSLGCQKRAHKTHRMRSGKSSANKASLSTPKMWSLGLRMHRSIPRTGLWSGSSTTQQPWLHSWQSRKTFCVVLGTRLTGCQCLGGQRRQCCCTRGCSRLGAHQFAE